jgi:hypothetical protein
LELSPAFFESCEPPTPRNYTIQFNKEHALPQIHLPTPSEN